MKLAIAMLSLLVATSAFAKNAGKEDASTKQLHAQICDTIKKGRPQTDLEVCKATGEIVLGGYDSEEIVYQVHRVELSKRTDREWYCIVSGPILIFEGCQDWKTVSRR